ncbi:unnamed protein product [marine sediment metagenome]|uniref:Peptidase M28 domain-containing protein n=1 Tax=marine sediment metagenome TaxID=412755 RepID=X0VH06_9ZZZZ
MINQWPDKFYHTSTDTLEKVDPSQLARVGSIGATYAYFLANAGPEEAKWLAEEVLSRHKSQVLTLTRDGVTRASGTDHPPREVETLVQRVRFLGERTARALESIRRLADVNVSPWQEETREFAEAELARIDKLIPPPPASPPADDWEKQAASIILRRLHPGPIDPKNFINRMSDEEYEAWWSVYKESPEATYAYPAMLLYWADGKRNVQEISDLIELEVGKRVTEMLVTCCQLWERLGLVELSTES